MVTTEGPPSKTRPGYDVRTGMMNKVDSYRFLGSVTARLVRSWIDREPRREIPWTPPGKPLNESTVAMLSSAGLALAGDRPFDQEGERRNPWWGDPSFRVIPRDALEGDVRAYHLHINNEHTEQDLNCTLPLTRLRELEQAGEIGRSAPSHFSTMGYLLDPTEMLEKSTPAMIRQMQDEQVDVVLLAPY
jgi:D-proline reductase (dithiol) PrdB